jgi:hypothetical protein
MCGRIGNSDVQCDCFSEYVNRNKDLSVCEGITDSGCRASCYESYAIRYDEPSLCEKIGDVEWKDSCYADVGRDNLDSLACGKVHIQSPEGCLIYVAEHKKNAEVCNLVTDASWGDDRLLCLLHVTGQESYCDKIRDPATKTSCIIDYQLSLGNVSACDMDTGEFRASCYKTAAVQSRSKSLCGKITSTYPDYLDLCYAVVAGLTSDIKGCALLKKKENLQICYESFAYDSARKFLDYNI